MDKFYESINDTHAKTLVALYTDFEKAFHPAYRHSIVTAP